MACTPSETKATETRSIISTSSWHEETTEALWGMGNVPGAFVTRVHPRSSATPPLPVINCHPTGT